MSFRSSVPTRRSSDLIIGVQVGFLKSDYYVARVLCGLLAVVALETLVNVVLEMYRPRVKGKLGRPLYESRLVGLDRKSTRLNSSHRCTSYAALCLKKK